MYIFKNAFKNISRSLGRNILIGIIVTVIAASCCVALSIRKSSENARESNMKNLNITAHINVDRSYVMEQIQNSGVDMSDRSAMQEVLKEASGLSLEEMQEYAKSEYVSNFYYTNMLILDGNDDLQPIDPNAEISSDTDADEETTEETTEATTEAQQGPGMGPDGQQGPGMDGQSGDGQMMGPGMQQQQQDPVTMMASQGDFKLTGYSADAAMDDFNTGVSTIKEGSMFDEDTEDMVCVISSELATYNNISVGDKITLQNITCENETYELEVVGIYKNSDSSSSMSTGNANDPANEILTSSKVVDSLVAASADYVEESDDEEDEETTTATVERQALSATTTGSYVFADMDGYDNFESYLKEQEGSKYVLTSSDVASYEASLVPLENLKSFATAFLLVILAIGAIILVVLNMFNIRERKYEVGVLTAVGMHKGKVALQFMLEIFIVTIFAILIGTGIGAATSVPITNKLLESQVQQQESSSSQTQSNFGRDQQQGPGGGQQMGGQGTFTKGGDITGPVNYIDSVSYAVDGVVVLQMVGIGILLSIISSLIAIIFIMRYQPLKILTERD
ncbi:putative ABC transport system permease protein [Lachnospiraceae bacterium NE2001]|nr:putative ABC transport system permease protein [Lachnospiraceae bacterium NE2001]